MAHPADLDRARSPAENERWIVSIPHVYVPSSLIAWGLIGLLVWAATRPARRGALRWLVGSIVTLMAGIGLFVPLVVVLWLISRATY